VLPGRRNVEDRRYFVTLVAVMITATFAACGITVTLLYRAAVDQQENRLREIVQSRGRLIAAVADFDAAQSRDYPGGPVEATLVQVREAHRGFQGMGDSGEFVLGRRREGWIEIVLNVRHGTSGEREPIAFSSELAEPMRRALSGHSGTMVGLDYRGEIVLAAYEPLPELGMGIVAKIDMAEVRAPFVQAAVLSAALASVLVLLGASVVRAVALRVRLRSEDQARSLDHSNAALRSSEARFSRVVDYLAEQHFFYAHGQDGVFTFVSPSISQVLGYTVEEFSCHFSEYFSEHPLNEIAEKRTQLSLQGEQQQPYELEIRHKDGTLLRLLVSETPVRDASGSVVSVEGIAQDISQQRLLEARLEEARNLESLGSLAAGVAHDFNNDLMVILGYCGMVGEELAAESPLHKYLGVIQSAGERSSRLTRQMLAFGRKAMLEPRRLDLNVLLAEIHTTLSERVGPTIALRVVPGADALWVFADHSQLEQMILNLVINAGHAMPDGGNLAIELGTARREGSGADGLTKEFAQLVVRDTGCGMSEETLSRVFEPFFTTRAPGEGTGLGLAGVHGFVKQSGGVIEVRSEPGVGTTFTVCLPLLAPELSEPVPEKTPRRAALSGSERVLLVEDEQAVRELLTALLEGKGYRVLAAASGEEAVSAYELEPESIDLVISDVVMPGLGGPEFVRQVGVPLGRVIFMSGYAREAFEGKLTGAAFLPKPVSPHALLEQVREVLDASGVTASARSNK
jgi:two-component system, cell cycle sensor histidine kinase and response regulator CckA